MEKWREEERGGMLCEWVGGKTERGKDEEEMKGGRNKRIRLGRR